MKQKKIVMIMLLGLIILLTAAVFPAVSTSERNKPVSPRVPGTASVSKALDVQSIGAYNIPDGARQVRVWGNYAYIIDGDIDGDMELQAIDISNPYSPRHTDTIWIYHPTISSSVAHHLDISGRYAYVANGYGFRVIDISNPADLKDVGGFEEAASGSILEVKGSYVFFPAAFNKEMYIVDVSNPAVPVKIGSFDPQKITFLWQIEISGHYAYLYGYNESFEIIDILSPGAPVFAGSFNCCGNINQEDVSYHVNGNYMYITVLSCLAQHCSNYFRVYNISNPQAVLEVGNYEIPANSEAVVGIAAADPYVFCAQGNSGVRVVNAANPASPVEAGVFNLPGYANDVFVSGGYIYVADLGTGLKIFKMASSPTVKITNLESGQYVGGSVDVQVQAYRGSDCIGKVEFYADGQKLDESGSSDCTFHWNSIPYPDGDHSLSVIAYDTANRTAAYEIYVVKNSSLPAISLNRTQFYFGAVEQGITNGPQDLFIDNSGGGTLNWSASGPDWLKLSPASGPGNATLSLSADTTGLSAGTYTGVVTISDPQASNSPVTVDVILTIYPAGGSAAPFGFFETPGDGDTVMSSIPVTGWCLDDIGVEYVKIYRDPVPGEGADLIYIGDATFIEGARPDVELSYPLYPSNYKAGWGYMMLTNFLPNHGNGTFQLYAFALDREGHHVTLGSKTITCDNAHAVKPFGAMDTPSQGGSASGSNFANFAWALTPLPNTIPPDGSTITVWVDGRPLGHPTYNSYREDIATLFPGYHNSNGALGYYYLDTAAFQNGVHTISWSVTDNAGNSDAIGSRFFMIQNSGSGSALGNLASMSSSKGTRINRKSLHLSAFEIDNLPVRFEKGWSNDTQSQEAYPDENGNIIIEIKELDRVTINLAPGRNIAHQFAGYLDVGGELRPLPIGSTFDPLEGIFYWQPGAGFIGNYTLVFTTADQDAERVTKKILIRIVPKF